MLLDRKAVAVGALCVASAIGGTLALASGCTVLTNDAPPDDAGLFEGGDARTSSCDVCLSAYCAAPQALCLTNAACVGVLAAPDSACSAEHDGGVSPERLYHAYTACNDAKLETCANDCAALNRAPSTLPACAAPDDGGITDAAAPDAGDADAGEPDATVPDAGETDASEASGPDACVACAAANCSAAVSACASATECGQFLACSSACKTASCVDDCAAQHATGKVAASELATCTASNCQKSCEL
jgi:hypothetical protein